MEFDTIELKFFESLKTRYLDNVYLGLANDENVIINHAWLACKDYLQDMYGVHYHGVGNCTIGGCYKKDNPPPSLTKMRLVVTGKIKDFEERAGIAISWLHYMESKMGLTKTKIYKVTNNPNNCECYLFEGDIWWISSPVMISTYSMFIRIFLEIKRPYNYYECLDQIERRYEHTRDAGYYRQGKKTLDYLFDHGPEKLFTKNFAENFKRGGGTLHSYSGFSAFGGGDSKSYYPQWYERMK